MKEKDNMKLRFFIDETVWKSSEIGPAQVTHKKINNNKLLKNKE
jgi:hypothetical protein